MPSCRRIQELTAKTLLLTAAVVGHRGKGIPNSVALFWLLRTDFFKGLSTQRVLPLHMLDMVSQLARKQLYSVLVLVPTWLSRLSGRKVLYK